MTRIFAYECYADEDVFQFLKDECKLPIRKHHAYGQGEVVNAVLVKRRADIGMVDEDPLSSHHSQRDQAQLISTTDNLVLRGQGDRYLIIVKPELEECFQRSMRIIGLRSSLPSRPEELRATLNISSHSKHKLFREELKTLYRESKARNVQTFVTDLENTLRKLL